MQKQSKWVLFRGLAREKRHWNDFPEHFTKALPTAQLEFLELPGVGEKYNEPAPRDLVSYVEGFREELHLKADDKINILTISLGGMIALEWAHRYPTEIDHMVIINSSSADFSPFYDRLLWPNYLTLLRSPFLKDHFEREMGVLDMTLNLRTDKKALAKAYASYAEEFPMKRMAFVNQLLAAARFKLSQAPIKTSMLFLNSLGDRFVHPSCSTKLAQHWNSPLRTHPTAGHDLPVDAGEWVSEMIKSYMEEF